MRRIYIITGVSGGIGNFLARHYAQKGFEVFGTYHSNQPEILPGVITNKVDVSNPNQVRDWVNGLSMDSAELVLINSAGITYNAFAHKSDHAIWKNVIDVNLFGSFNTSSLLLPHMREKKFGRIINFSSVVAQSGVMGTSAYAASKAGLWGMSKTLAIENATKGITVNTLNLGYFDIGMIIKVPDDMQKQISAKIPVNRFGDPENIVAAVDFLVKSDYTTGESININGGLY